MTAFLTWLENTGYSEWILTSAEGWPLMLTIHALGLALIVGIVFAMNLRMLGFYATIPITSLDDILRISWIGIWLNVITGLSIFMTQANMYVHSVPFILKISFIILGIINLVFTQKTLRREAGAWQAAGKVPQKGVLLAASSLVFWVMAIVTGRLIAYI
ncbi:MAG TPA: hypothetical protein VIC71_08190 [Gammaproteobacteria bacterium]|jgi:hypothetical protein